MFAVFCAGESYVFSSAYTNYTRNDFIDFIAKDLSPSEVVAERSGNFGIVCHAPLITNTQHLQLLGVVFRSVAELGGQGAMPHKTPEVALCPVELSNVALRIMAPESTRMETQKLKTFLRGGSTPPQTSPSVG